MTTDQIQCMNFGWRSHLDPTALLQQKGAHAAWRAEAECSRYHSPQYSEQGDSECAKHAIAGYFDQRFLP